MPKLRNKRACRAQKTHQVMLVVMLSIYSYNLNKNTILIHNNTTVGIKDKVNDHQPI